MTDAPPIEAGDLVDVTFTKSIVTGSYKLNGHPVLVVQTAVGELTFDPDAADTTVTRAGTRRHR